MLKIIDLDKSSPLCSLGIGSGDYLVSINGYEINDLIDYRFYQSDSRLELVFGKNNQTLGKLIRKDIDADLGLAFAPDRIRRCKNKCVFCFVDNNPRGLRHSIYIKDDDYRMSFLLGNFVTMTNLSESDIERIIRFRLSPLFISVQATDEAIRRRLFGRADVPPILPILERLAANSIRFHCQVVIAPGLNDGIVLDNTAAALSKFRPYAESLAVVPVGLTKHTRRQSGSRYMMKAVGKREAVRLINQVANYRRAYGDKKSGFAYAADELFIKIGMPIPESDYYDNYPQLENGVGMVRQFLNSFESPVVRRKKTDIAKSGLWVTGISMMPIWQNFIFKKYPIALNLIPVKNSFLGKTVTVTGLLAGADILRQLRKIRIYARPIILPPNCLNADEKFIDDMTAQDLADELQTEVIQGTYDFAETLRLIL